MAHEKTETEQRVQELLEQVIEYEDKNDLYGAIIMLREAVELLNKIVCKLNLKLANNH